MRREPSFETETPLATGRELATVPGLAKAIEELQREHPELSPAAVARIFRLPENRE
jgi:1,6-anhydro-N-acetylmuramate kinase